MINVETVSQIETKDTKKQNQKLFKTTRYRKGLKLYALNPENLLVYEVEIETVKTFNAFRKINESDRKANINPKHLHLWALNMNNAKRKFLQIFKQKP